MKSHAQFFFVFDSREKSGLERNRQRLFPCLSLSLSLSLGSDDDTDDGASSTGIDTTRHAASSAFLFSAFLPSSCMTRLNHLSCLSYDHRQSSSAMMMISDLCMMFMRSRGSSARLSCVGVSVHMIACVYAFDVTDALRHCGASSRICG